MLRIVFGEKPEVLYGPVWFDYNYEPEWFKDELVKDMISAVDNSRYVDGEYIESEVLGPISPRNLSGGVKTLICIYKNPDKVFDATSCGGNCAKWILEIGRKEDVTINLKYLMRFKDYEPFEIYVENLDKIVRTNKDYVLAAMDFV